MGCAIAPRSTAVFMFIRWGTTKTHCYKTESGKGGVKREADERGAAGIGRGVAGSVFEEPTTSARRPKSIRLLLLQRIYHPVNPHRVCFSSSFNRFEHAGSPAASAPRFIPNNRPRQSGCMLAFASSHPDAATRASHQSPLILPLLSRCLLPRQPTGSPSCSRYFHSLFGNSAVSALPSRTDKASSMTRHISSTLNGFKAK